jgi:hypothetical protein
MKSLTKRKTPSTEGLPNPKKKSNFDIAIISESDNEAQGVCWRTSAKSELNHFIQRQELESCLEWLEARGFRGETALFLLSCLQQSGGAN